MNALKAPPRDSPVGSGGRVRRPSNATYRKAIEGYVEEIDGLISDLAAGTLTPEEWGDAFDGVLYRAHTEAWVLGRQRAGDLSPESLDDRRMGLDAKDLQSEYLQGFQDAIQSGDTRYFDAEGNLNETAVRHRARQYMARARGTANEAFLAAGEADDEYDWELGPTEHCDDCRELAGLGPYTESTAISHPGDGQTECKANCHCRWKRRRDGLYGFDRVDIYLGSS